MREQLKTGCAAWFRDVLDAVPNGWIAGGAVRDYFSRTPTNSDIDVFFKSAKDLADGLKSIKKAKARLLYTHEHVEGFLLNRKHVQLIKKHFFAGPAETIAEFDFTVCCAAVDHAGEVYTHEHFFEDLAGKRLAINSLPFPLSTLERLQKYAQKGFLACNGTLMEIAVGIQSIDLQNPTANTLTFYPNGGRRFTRFD